MEKRTLISGGEYNEILQWLNEEVDIRTESLCEEQIIAMRNTFSFQRWRMEKAYREFAAVMRKTPVGSILIKMFEKIFC
ncbi:hypothetical protein ES705_44426 [subsurface metagenome]